MSNFWFRKSLHRQIKPELVSIWFVLGVTGSPCSRQRPDIGRLSQMFPDLAPLGSVWLEPGVCGHTLGPSEAVWQPDCIARTFH